MHPRRSVLAYHVVFGAYGFWLPNDPRGSWSEQVWADHLQAFGPATKVETRQSLAKQPHNKSLREHAKQALLYPPVRFTGVQACEIARGFAEAVAVLPAQVYATAIMPDHIHFVLARVTQKVEAIVGGFKRFATRALVAAGCHPLAHVVDSSGRTPSPWCIGCWKVFLFTVDEIERAMQYVNDNPVRAGFKPQSWSFVTPYGD